MPFLCPLKVLVYCTNFQQYNILHRRSYQISVYISRGHQGDSLLHCGASTAQLEIVKFCLQVMLKLLYVVVSGFQEGLKPDILNSLTETPLHKVSFISMIPRTKTIMQIIKVILAHVENHYNCYHYKSSTITEDITLGYWT